MGEALGRTVGYMIGADRVVGRNTSIRFVTTGWAFEKLIHNENFLTEITHFVLDEVHERTIDADLLHLLIKLVLPKMPPAQRPKVILMSATFNASVFSTYYSPENPPEPLFVGVNRYPTVSYFVETFHKCPALLGIGNLARTLTDCSEQKRLGVGGQANTLFVTVCRLIHDYHAALNEPCCILVFLSGIAEIDALWEHLEQSEEQDGAVRPLSDEELSFEDELADNEPPKEQPHEQQQQQQQKKKSALKTVLSRFQLCMLHSSVEKEDQMTIFSELPVGKTRIILSTNIAESSVTIPNARYVIDGGYHKHMAYDERLGCTSLKTVVISAAAAKQRAGRTGRLFPGTVLRFYTEDFANEMPDYDEPDMLRLPLFNTVLRLKVASQDDLGFASPLARPSEALSFAIDPPTRRQIESAYTTLFKYGHMVSGGTEDLDDSVVTPLGKFLQQLNVDVRLGAVVVTALVLFPDYLPHAIVLSVAMGIQNVFIHANPRTGGSSAHAQASFFDLLSRTERKRMAFNGDLYSDALTALRAYGEQPGHERGGNWAHRHGLHGTRMQQLHSQVMELAQRLIPMVPSHLTKDLQNLMARNFTFSLTPEDTRILRFLLMYSLNDMLLQGTVQLQEKKLGNPKKVGDYTATNCPYKDWRSCVFFMGVPMEVLEMGGAFERQLVATLFACHGLKPRLHVTRQELNRKTGTFEATVILEFQSPEDATFAEAVLMGCAKTGKIVLWISDSAKVTIPAPTKRAALSLGVVHTGMAARLTGASAVHYVTTPGTHFFIPGQAIFANNSLFVEDVTWLPGSEDWVWKSMAICPAMSRVAEPGIITYGVKGECRDMGVPEDEFAHLVYLKHLTQAALSTQFNVAGRLDIGVQIARHVLGFHTEQLALIAAPPRKSPNNKTLAKDQPAFEGKAQVIMLSAGKEGADAKLTVVKGLTLQGVLSVAGARVLKCPGDQVVVRVSRSGRVIGSDEVLNEVLSKEADTMGVLRMDVSRKGVIVLKKGGAEEWVPSRPLEVDSGLSRLALACSSTNLPHDGENDAWLVRTMVDVLRLRSDGRLFADELCGSVKFMAKQPERVTPQRLVDLALLHEDTFDFEKNTFILLDGATVPREFAAPFVVTATAVTTPPAPAAVWVAPDIAAEVFAPKKAAVADAKKKPSPKKKGGRGGTPKKATPAPVNLPPDDVVLERKFETLSLKQKK